MEAIGLEIERDQSAWAPDRQSLSVHVTVTAPDRRGVQFLERAWRRNVPLRVELWDHPVRPRPGQSAPCSLFCDPSYARGTLRATVTPGVVPPPGASMWLLFKDETDSVVLQRKIIVPTAAAPCGP